MARSIAGTAPSRTNRRFLIIAVLLAGLSAALMYATISRDSEPTTGEVSAGSTQVVVARVAVKQRTTLTSEMLTVKAVPTSNVILGAYTSLEDALGKVTKYPIEANEQVVSASVVDTSKPVSDAALSLVVPAGKRAIAIKASQVGNAGGLILPGDYVDLVWICCEGRAVLVKTVLQNVQVAAVAQSIIDSGPSAEGSEPVAGGEEEAVPDANTMTLLLTPAEVHQVFMAELTGEIRADLRGIGDIDRVSEDFTLVTDLLPIEVVDRLPEDLRPDGYKPAGR